MPYKLAKLKEKELQIESNITRQSTYSSRRNSMNAALPNFDCKSSDRPSIGGHNAIISSTKMVKLSPLRRLVSGWRSNFGLALLCALGTLAAEPIDRRVVTTSTEDSQIFISVAEP